MSTIGGSPVRKNTHIEDARCSCRGDTLDRLLQPRILSLLARQPFHGYSIIQTLKAERPAGLESDDTAVYRALRTLESRRMIRSEWALDQSGPAKKVYLLTEKGTICLSNWIATLKEYMRSIEMIIEDSSLGLTTCVTAPDPMADTQAEIFDSRKKAVSGGET